MDNQNQTKRVSLNYLRRISDNYNLTAEKAKELFPNYEIVDDSNSSRIKN